MARKKKLDPEATNKKHKDWLLELGKFQESDLDQREQAREADRFLLEKDGQWEDDIAQQLDSQRRPRYTFDKVTPIVESMMAEIEDMDFGCNVKPDGNGSNKEVAETYEGMVRTIQNMSKSDDLFRKACRRIMRRGFDAWMVKAKYKDPWSFEQDLFIVPIPNAINRVWGMDTSVEADGSDNTVQYVLTSMSKEQYKDQFPEGRMQSIDDGDQDEHFYDYVPEVVTIGERYWRKKTNIEVVQLSNGKVVRYNEEFQQIEDDLRDAGVTVVNKKKIQDYVWCHQTFDGATMLDKEKETVFRSNPIVTVYGNHELLGKNSKLTYSGIVLKEMDSQRVHNYAKSREIEEGALAPRAKWWMTMKQAKGHTDQIGRMNISADPVQFFNPDPESPGVPQRNGGPEMNPHLASIGLQMANDIKEQAGVFSAMQGDFAGRMSEETVRMQVDRGTAATRKWVNALICGIRRTCEILVETIPYVYDTKRVFTITSMDGVEQEATLNEEVLDQETQSMIKMNDLNMGKYRVTCDAGPAFANKLEAGLQAMMDYAAIDPSIVQQAGDLMVKSIDAPMMDKVAERKRMQLIQAGQIPFEQMTDEEKEQAQAQAQQPPQPDPNMVLAQAELKKADVQAAELQLKQQQVEIEGQRVQLEMMKLQQAASVAGQKATVEEAKAISDIQNKNADTTKKIAETEKISGESIRAQVEVLGSLAPNVQ